MPVPSVRHEKLVSIIVVNFNGGDKLRRCISALIATSGSSEIIIVDNASTDRSMDLTAELAHRVRLIRNPTNIGYAAALNQAARLTRGDILIFSNMDIVPEEGWLEPLVSTLAERADAGAVNPLVVLASGQQVNAAGQNIHVTGLGFNNALGLPVSLFDEEPFEVPGIQGALFAMRRDVFAQIGGLDETGFLYHEDVNVSWLLRLAGYRLYCIPSSRVRHDYFLSMHAEKFHFLERNRLAMILAYTNPLTRTVLAPIFLLTEALAWIYALLRRNGFPSAKWRTYLWIASHRKQIGQRRQGAKELRRISDWTVLRGFSWMYDWRQFSVLALERGRGRRRRFDHTSGS
jgi:GT2 family glycosyltransferase